MKKTVDGGRWPLVGRAVKTFITALVFTGHWPLATGHAAGTSAAEFLTLDVGARAAAMGGAHAALAKGAEALAWNPAGLNDTYKRSASLMHASQGSSSRLNYAAFALNLDRNEVDGAVGAAVRHFSAGHVVERDAAGADLGRLSPNDLALTAGFAASYRSVSLGAAWKYVRTRLKDSAHTRSLDIGLLSPPFWQNRLRLGLAAVNLGGRLHYDETYDHLPTALRLGSAFRPSGRLLAAWDGVWPRGGRPYTAAGAEYRLLETSRWSWAARAGFNTGPSRDLGGVAGVSAGFGIEAGRVSLDYGIVPMGDLDLVHRVSFAFDF